MSRHRILIVDDDSATRRLIGQILRPLDSDLEFAIDGVAALDRVSESRPDLILLDIALPRIDGWRVLDTLRQGHPATQVPIIVITAHGQGTVAERALRGGADRFFEKPFLPDELAAAVVEVLLQTPVRL